MIFYITSLFLHFVIAKQCHAFVGGKMRSDRPNYFKTHALRDTNDDESPCFSRRMMLSIAGSVSSGPFLSLYRSLCNGQLDSNSANAMGLVQFPCPEGSLMNKYHLMRAGESSLEEQNILSTNPLFLTNTEDGLTLRGRTQVEEACNILTANNVNPSVVKYSLASKSIDTVNTIANTLLIGRNRIVPEFTFMDPRGAGNWNGKELSTTEAALFALDFTEAGNDGRDGRPPPNEDGTANETLFDQVVRLRQLMSVLETQYSGDDILLVFPDGSSPALLSCLIAGIPLKDVHAFNFLPGELRIDVNMKTILKTYAERKAATEYVQTLEIGTNELIRLKKEQELLDNAQQGPGTLLVPSKRPSLLPQREAEFDDGILQGQSRIEDRIAKRKDAAVKRRQAYVNDSLRRSQESSSSSEDMNYPTFSDYMPVASLGAIASMAIWRPREDDVEERISMTKEATYIPKSHTNSTGIMLAPTASRQIINQTAALPMVTQDPELSNVFEDKPVLSIEERIDAANQAMMEYLERDDGSEDWLRSLKDILDDE